MTPIMQGPDWPTATRTVTSRDGTKINVVDAGQGRSIVFVHGLGLTNEVWLPQIRELQKTHRVLAIDIRGHGDSSEGVEGYSPALFAEDINAVLTELDLTDAILVGHSLGGCTIGQFVVDHPNNRDTRVAGLVLVGTFGSALNGEGWWRERFGRQQSRALASMLGRRKQPATPPSGRIVTAMTKRSFAGDAHPDDIAKMIAIGVRTPPSIVAACMKGNLSYDVIDRLGDVPTPAMVIVGSKDRTAKPSSAKRIATALPNAELIVLDGVGHPVGLQRPDELTRLIRRAASAS